MATKTDDGVLTDHPDLADWDSYVNKKYGDNFAANDSRQAVNDLESNTPPPPEAPGNKNSGDNDSGGGKKSFWGRLTAGSKGYLPTGGLIGLILGAFGITSAVLSPMSLLVNFTDMLSNHTSLGDHLYVKAGNSYIASLLKGEGRNCAESKIKCKFATISEDRMKEWKERGINVTNAEKTVTGRYKIRGLEYKGKEVTSLSEYKNLKNTNPEFNSLLKRFPVRAYLMEKGPFRKGTLTKFGLDIKNKFKSSTDEDKQTREAANDKAMNSETKASVDENGNISETKIKSEVDEKTNSATSETKSKLSDGVGKTLQAVNIAAGVGSAACTTYDLVRATQAATILLWHTKLIEFALPFLQAGSQAKEAGVNGGFDWQTAEYFGDRATHPITEQDVKNNPDLYSSDMIGKTAMDSEGFNAVLNGQSTTFTGDITNASAYPNKYTGWAPAQQVLGSGIMNNIQSVLGGDDKAKGRKNIHDACLAIKIAGALSLAACIGPQAVTCGATMVGQLAFQKLFGDKVLDAVTEELQKPAINLIAKANLSASLVGPPLGQALVSAAGVMSSYMDTASGFAYAGSDTQAKTAYNDMYTDQDYIQGQIAEAKQEASKNQFDPNNRYSFVGQLSSKFTGVQWDGTLFSSIANLATITADSPSLLSSAYAEQQGLYQPIQVYDSDKLLQGTLDSCVNPGMEEISTPCLGESGRPVPTYLPAVQKCLDAEEKDGEPCINQAITWLSTHTYNDGKDSNGKDIQKPYIDGNSGEPTDFSSYKNDQGSQDDYKNPMLMFMGYCGRDRVYPVGYTDKSIDTTDKDGAGTDNYDWYVGSGCVASSDTTSAEVCSGGDCAATPNGDSDRDTALAWMAYYTTMCTMAAGEDGQDYCWQEQAAPTPTGGDWVMPVAATCGDGFHPTTPSTIGRTHMGIDLLAAMGTPIVAPTNLKIVGKQDLNRNKTGGNTLLAVATDGSNQSFIFMHLKELPSIAIGTEVAKGTPIAIVGSTGTSSSGPHLHLEMDATGTDPNSFSNEIDPVKAFAEHGVLISGCR